MNPIISKRRSESFVDLQYRYIVSVLGVFDIWLMNNKYKKYLREERIIYCFLGICIGWFTFPILMVLVRAYLLKG